MNKSKKLAKILKVIIYVMMFFLVVMIYIWIGKLINNNIKGIDFFSDLVLAGSFLFILFFARKIMNSIINNIHFSFLFYLSFGFLSIILSEIFNKAYKLKREKGI